MKFFVRAGLQGVLFAFLLGIHPACKNSVGKPQMVIARVGKSVLTFEDLKEDIPEQFQQTLSPAELREFALRWIDNQVLYAEAVNRDIDERQDLQREFDKLQRELMISKLLELAVPVGKRVAEGEVRSYYDSNHETFVLTEDLVRVHHLLVATKEKATAIRKRMKTTDNVAELIETFELDSTLANDWDPGYFSANEVIPEISKIAFKLAPQAVSFPIKSKLGYHLIRLVDKKKKGDVQPFELVKDEIEQKLLTKKRLTRHEGFLREMKSKITIETFFESFALTTDSLTYAGERQ